MDYKNIFICKLGIPTTEENLNNYINFVLNNSILENNIEYKEQHHILPKSKFPEYIKETNNLFYLEYKNHIEAHRLLVIAYPIRSFLRPLNFMLNRKDKENLEFKKLLSESIKLWWKEFKTTENYILYCNIKREQTSERMKNGFSKELSQKRFSVTENREKVSLQFKSLWEDEHYRTTIINSIKSVRGTKESKEKSSKISQERWKNISEKDYEDFYQKMKNINSSPEKLENNSNKMKEKWKEEEYLQKMKNRKKRGSDGTKSKLLWADPIWKANMLEKRKLTREKRKNETNTN